MHKVDIVIVGASGIKDSQPLGNVEVSVGERRARGNKDWRKMRDGGYQNRGHYCCRVLRHVGVLEGRV